MSKLKATLCIRFILVLVSSILIVAPCLTAGEVHLRPYTESSVVPLPMTYSALQGKTLLGGPGTFSYNTASVPTIVACTNAEIISTLSARHVWDRYYSEGMGEAHRKYHADVPHHLLIVCAFFR